MTVRTSSDRGNNGKKGDTLGKQHFLEMGKVKDEKRRNLNHLPPMDLDFFYYMKYYCV